MSEAITAAWIAAGAAFGGGLAGGLVSGAYQHLRDILSRPVLSIDYQNDEYHKVDFANENCGYVRVGVQNKGRDVAKQCRVFLERLEEVQASGKTTRAIFLGPRQLAWAGFEHVSLVLPSRLDFYVDVLNISKSSPEWGFRTGLFACEQSLKTFQGTYRFHLIATSDNAEPVRRTIDVYYAGDWNGLRVVTTDP